jgi:glycosyltransferase involved in cell wall biosynthesis
MILGINASRARSGGAKSHLIGILSTLDFKFHGYKKIHVWSYKNLLQSLPNKSWLIKHNVKETNKSILKQIWWEFLILPKELKKKKCDILLNVDAGSVCQFKPYVTMSRDMLSYEPGQIKKYKFSLSSLRLIIIKYIQNSSLRNSTGAIFLTRYAAKIIQNSSGIINNFIYIPHGVSEKFRIKSLRHDFSKKKNYLIRCLYVSNLAPYKNQWHVVRAIKILRDKGFNLQLTLTCGGFDSGYKLANDLLKKELNFADPSNDFVKIIGYIEQNKLPNLLKKSDIFIFASSCENMPNTLIEAMCSGLPIASSNKGPMPEILKKGGIYFDPENPKSIAKSIQKLLINKRFRLKLSREAEMLSKKYTWKRCSKETFTFISKVLNQYRYY